MRHLLPSCYKDKSSDSNERRRKPGEPLKHTRLKEEAIPTVWPNVPIKLLKDATGITPRLCFAKNLVAEINSHIHKSRKRQGPVEEKKRSVQYGIEETQFS